MTLPWPAILGMGPDLGIWLCQARTILPAAWPGSLAGGPAACVRHGEYAAGVRLGKAIPRFPHEWSIAWQAGRDDRTIGFDQHENILA